MVSDTITVTMGEQAFSPVPYNTFRVGPLTYTTSVNDHETPEEAVERATAVLIEQFQTQFEIQKEAFLERLEVLQDEIPNVQNRDVFSAGSTFK